MCVPTVAIVLTVQLAGLPAVTVDWQVRPRCGFAFPVGMSVDTEAAPYGAANGAYFTTTWSEMLCRLLVYVTEHRAVPALADTSTHDPAEKVPLVLPPS